MIGGWRSSHADRLNAVIDKEVAQHGNAFTKGVLMDYLITLGLNAFEGHEKTVAEVKAAPAKPKAKRFVKPTVEQIYDYMAKSCGTPEGIAKTEAEKFFNWYEGNGWMAGKNKMKDWQATARNWINRSIKDSVKKADKCATPDRSGLFKEVGVSDAPMYNPLAIGGNSHESG